MYYICVYIYVYRCIDVSPLFFKLVLLCCFDRLGLEQMPLREAILDITLYSGAAGDYYRKRLETLNRLSSLSFLPSSLNVFCVVFRCTQALSNCLYVRPF